MAPNLKAADCLDMPANFGEWMVGSGLGEQKQFIRGSERTDEFLLIRKNGDEVNTRNS